MTNHLVKLIILLSLDYCCYLNENVKSENVCAIINLLKI